jgi:hypothetical protein
MDIGSNDALATHEWPVKDVRLDRAGACDLQRRQPSSRSTSVDPGCRCAARKRGCDGDAPGGYDGGRLCVESTAPDCSSAGSSAVFLRRLGYADRRI